MKNKKNGNSYLNNFVLKFLKYNQKLYQLVSDGESKLYDKEDV